MLVADRPNRVVAHHQPAELAEVRGGSVERPTGSGQTQQPLGVGADEPGDPEPVVERGAAGFAPGTDEVEPFEPDDPGGTQDVANGASLGPSGPVARGAGPPRRPFFSAASA